MEFARFRELAGWTCDEAAEKIRESGDERFARVNASMVSKHERGVTFPSPELIDRYMQITDGAVTFSDWLAVRQAQRARA